jgi:hypothetical protein
MDILAVILYSHLTTLLIVASAEIPICWALALYPFLFRPKQQKRRASVIAPKARWGIGLQILAFVLVSVICV